MQTSFAPDDSPDRAIDDAIKVVLEPLDSKDGLLRRLGQSWVWDLVVSGYSDSWQGGFVIEPEILARVGVLGLGLQCTVYNEDEDDDQCDAGPTPVHDQK